MTERTELLAVVAQANPVPDPVAAAEHLDVYRSLLAVIDERSEAMQSPTIERESVTPLPRPPRRRAVWAFAAAFVVALVVIGIAALLTRNDEVPVVDNPTTTTTVITTTSTRAPATTVTTVASEPSAAPDPPPTAAPQPTIAMSRVPDIPAFEGGSINGIVLAPSGLVAVGVSQTWIPDENALLWNPKLREYGYWDSYAAAWVSSDGVTWSPAGESAALPAANADEPADGIADVLVGADGLVAVGGSGHNGAAWWSPDGLDWTRAAGDVFEADDAVGIDRVVVGGLGYVAVGRYESMAGVWVSADGRTWDRADDPDLMVEQDLAVARDVASGPAGLVVVGQLGFSEDRFFSGSGERAAAWFSTDGLEWDLLPGDTFGDVESVWLEEVKVRGDEFVISGSVDEESRAWSSADGRSWVDATESITSFDILPASGERMAGQLVGLDEEGMVWVTEDDGATWRAFGILSGWPPEAADAGSIGAVDDFNVTVVVGSRLVIGGTVETEAGFAAAIWIAELET